MLRAEQLVHQRLVHSDPLVLGATPLKTPAPAVDRDQPVSRRFEPNSRTTLIGEQPNPWKLLHLQDVMSRHRYVGIFLQLLGGSDYIFFHRASEGSEGRNEALASLSTKFSMELTC